MPTDDVPSARRQTQAGVLATEQLLALYRRRRNQNLRDQLVERHRAVVESMARHLAMRLPPSVDRQDLVHAGIWGLIQSIDNYRPARCDQFLGFLRIRVRGAMLDELRNMDWVPRLWRRRQRNRDQATMRLRAALLREPSEQELAQELGVSLQVLQRAYAGRGRLQLASSVPREDGDGGAEDAMDRLVDDGYEPPIEALHRRELIGVIRQSLQPVEWQVLQLHYLEGMSGKEVAQQLRLSAARICQIHGRVLDRLKTRLRAMAV